MRNNHISSSNFLLLFLFVLSNASISCTTGGMVRYNEEDTLLLFYQRSMELRVLLFRGKSVSEIALSNVSIRNAVGDSLVQASQVGISTLIAWLKDNLENHTLSLRELGQPTMKKWKVTLRGDVWLQHPTASNLTVVTYLSETQGFAVITRNSGMSMFDFHGSFDELCEVMPVTSFVCDFEADAELVTALFTGDAVHAGRFGNHPDMAVFKLAYARRSDTFQLLNDLEPSLRNASFWRDVASNNVAASSITVTRATNEWDPTGGLSGFKATLPSSNDNAGLDLWIHAANSNATNSYSKWLKDVTQDCQDEIDKDIKVLSFLSSVTDLNEFKNRRMVSEQAIEKHADMSMNTLLCKELLKRYIQNANVDAEMLRSLVGKAASEVQGFLRDSFMPWFDCRGERDFESGFRCLSTIAGVCEHIPNPKSKTPISPRTEIKKRDDLGKWLEQWSKDCKHIQECMEKKLNSDCSLLKYLDELGGANSASHATMQVSLNRPLTEPERDKLKQKFIVERRSLSADFSEQCMQWRHYKQIKDHLEQLNDRNVKIFKRLSNDGKVAYSFGMTESKSLNQANSSHIMLKNYRRAVCIDDIHCYHQELHPISS